MTNTLTGHDVEEGGLPNGWSTERIADVLAELPNGKVLKQGKSPQCEKEPSPSDEVWGVLKTTAIQPGEFLPVHNKRLPSSREPDGSIEVANGDLLLTCAGPRVRCGVPCLVRETRPRLMLSGKMYRFRPNEELIGAGFLEGYLLSPGAQEHIEKMKTGTSDSGLNLTQGRFSELPVPIPPLEEQERIVEILEAQLSRLDTALQSVRTVREKAAQFRRSLLHAAFTGSLTGHDVEEGELPEGWKRPLLDEINDPDRPICYGILMPGPDLSEGVPYVKVKNMRDNRVLLEGVHRTSPEIEQKFARSRLRAGDLLLSIRGTFGKTAIVPSELDGGNVTQDTARIAPIGAKTPYLFRYLQSPQAQNFFKTVARGVAVRGVNIRDLRQLPVVVPPLPEQERIVEILEDQLSRLDASLAVADAVEERSAALRRSLLHSAFTGRLTSGWREAVNV